MMGKDLEPAPDLSAKFGHDQSKNPGVDTVVNGQTGQIQIIV